jgi:hypothetical protein
LSDSARKEEGFAQFDVAIQDSDLRFLLGSGLKDAAHRAASCMGWVWRQWLAGVPKRDLTGRGERFVERGLELRTRSSSYHLLALHDLYLLHCAIFASGAAQLRRVAEQIADVSGDKGQKPLDDGELYAAAWCGMMKYWILGDDKKAAEQSALIWSAYREPGIFAAPKPLVTPWLKRDWAAFAKQQQKDFDKLWTRARKDRWTVKAENSTEIVVTTERYQIEHMWCWAHCGIAMLAHREGVKVINDPFWFPAVALEYETANEHRKKRDDTDQLRMF